MQDLSGEVARITATMPGHRAFLESRLERPA
jgi:hypothetical protein